MKLTLNTPHHSAQYAVGWLEINTPTGNYIIQKGHAPMIVALSFGQPLIFRLKNGKQESFVVRHGIIRIDRTSATVVMTVME